MPVTCVWEKYTQKGDFLPLYHNDGGRCGVRFGLFIIRSKNNNIVKLKTKNNIFVMCSGLAQCCNHAATAVKLAIAVACQHLIGHFTTSSLTPIVQQHRKIVNLHTNQPYTFAVLIFLKNIIVQCTYHKFLFNQF